MLSDFICPNCSISFTINLNELTVGTGGICAICPVCGYSAQIRTFSGEASLAENITNPHGLEVLKIGDVVQVTNSEHVWYNEFAVICDVKPLFYRIEVMGRKMWVPQHWVKINELNDIN